MPRNKEDLSISMTIDVSPDEGERYRVLATLEIEDGGRPFSRTRCDWYDVPDEGVDFIAHVFETIVQGEMPLFVERASERQMLDIEQRAISALSQLNALGNATEGKTREEKDAHNKQFVKALGIRGKGDKYKNKNPKHDKR